MITAVDGPEQQRMPWVRNESEVGKEWRESTRMRGCQAHARFVTMRQNSIGMVPTTTMRMVLREEGRGSSDQEERCDHQGRQGQRARFRRKRRRRKKNCHRRQSGAETNRRFRRSGASSTCSTSLAKYDMQKVRQVRCSFTPLLSVGTFPARIADCSTVA